MPTIRPNLWFNQDIDPIAQFYLGIFPEASIAASIRFGEEFPEHTGELMFIALDLGGSSLVLLNGAGQDFPFSEAVSLEIECKDQAEVDHYWDKFLADGGEPGPCGWLKDKYGITWQVAPTRLTELLMDPDPARAMRVSTTMMHMQRIVLSELEAAADGK